MNGNESCWTDIILMHCIKLDGFPAGQDINVDDIARICVASWNYHCYCRLLPWNNGDDVFISPLYMIQVGGDMLRHGDELV